MEEQTRIFDHIPKTFDSLPADYFSLGQSEEYYEHISEFAENIRHSILEGLRDIAFDLRLYSTMA